MAQDLRMWKICGHSWNNVGEFYYIQFELCNLLQSNWLYKGISPAVGREWAACSYLSTFLSPSVFHEEVRNIPSSIASHESSSYADLKLAYQNLRAYMEHIKVRK